MKRLGLMLVIFTTHFSPFNAIANDEDMLPKWEDETLTGDWNGTRKDLYNKGVDFQMFHKSDVLTNLHGGIRRGTSWIGLTEAQVGLDLDRLFGWQGTSALITIHSHLGGKFNSSYVGAVGGEDNIEVSTDTTELFQAWIQHNWLDDRFSVLAGLYGIDTEFNVTNASGVFLLSNLGASNEFSQSGRNGPAIFPLGAIAVRMKYVTPSTHFYIQGAVTDGVPGDPNKPYGTRIVFGHGDGVLGLLEFGYTPPFQAASETPNPSKDDAHDAPKNYINKTAIGLWHYSQDLDDLVDVDVNGNPIKRPSHGIYFLSERALKLEKDDPSQGLTGFIRLGFAASEVQEVDMTSSVGFQYIGLIPNRNNDISGIALSYSHASNKYKLVNDSRNEQVDVEVTYKAEIKPWLFIQPNFQYISHPGMDKNIKDAKVIGFRTEIQL